jgi:superfamily II DNA helicase RecQ
MKNLENIIKKHLRNITEGEIPEQENYMFFGNIEQMKRQCELLMNEDKTQIDSILKEHDWAQDHIAEAKSLLDQVFDFLMNQTNGSDGEMDESLLNEEYHIDESKNCPTDPKKWSASKAAAKSKFDVYPSAYANGWAAKNYKSKGGRWKKCKKSTNESINEEKSSKSYEVYHKSYTSAINAALEYVEKRGYEYDKEESASEIGSGPKKPSEGKTNRFSLTLKKDGKEQKKKLHIQVYGMGEKYELNCYIS